MTAKERNTWIVTAFVTLLIAGAATLLVVMPKLEARSAAATEAALTKQTASTTLATATQLEAKAAQLDETYADAVELTSKFPNEYDQGSWLNLMYDAAAQSKVKITSLVPSVPGTPDDSGIITGEGPLTIEEPPAVPGAPVAPLDPNAPVDPNAAPVDPNAAPVVTRPIAESLITLKAVGESDNLVTFLSKLQQDLPRPLIINGLQLTEERGFASLSLTGSTYLTEPLDVPPGYDPPVPDGF